MKVSRIVNSRFLFAGEWRESVVRIAEELSPQCANGEHLSGPDPEKMRMPNDSGTGPLRFANDLVK